MPPKKKKEVNQDDRFQAIVLTDSFETRFMPLTSVGPRCLLPLANVPLIEYTLEFLAKAGVNEVYVMCSAHADQVQSYIESSKWSQHNSPFSIQTIMSLESRSVGDAMRDLDNRGLITGDFLLVSGDVVTNIDFSKAMKFHKHKKQNDKEHILTMVLTNADPYHRTRSHIDPAAFILDTKTNRCLYYQNIPPSDGAQSSIAIDPELLEDVDEFIVRNDLIDCNVDICTPHVPQIFQDNFDYQFLRCDFVKGVLTSDLVKKTIYSYIADGTEYAARVESFGTYKAISQDILGRWCYPLVPDSNLLKGNTYTYEFNHIYKEEKVVLAQSSRVGNCTCIGTNTSIGDKSVVEKSVIGKNCKIGNNVTIKNSYIWDNAVIGDNAVIDDSIVATHVVVGESVIINSGSVIGFNVHIGKGKHIPSNTRLVETPIQSEDHDFDDSFSDEEKETTSTAASEVSGLNLVGEDGVGYVYTSGTDDDDESDLEDDRLSYAGSMIYNLKTLNISDDSIASLSNKKKKKKNRRLSTTSAISDYDAQFSDEEEDFNKEAVATVTRSIENNHDLDTALLELNTLRMSMNVTYHEVRMSTVEALVKRIAHFIGTETLSAKDATNKIFNTWGPLFRRQVFDTSDQVDLLQILQETAAKADPSYNEVVLFCAVQVLYQLDIVEEEKIYEWWDSPESTATESLTKVRQATGKFVEWLREAEEESD